MFSLSTLLISPHFPEYAIQYPAILLVLGLAYSVLSLIELFDIKMRQAKFFSNRWGIFLPALVSVVVLLGITIPGLPKLRASYQEIMMHNKLRHAVFQHIIDIYQTTGQTHFILTRCPVRSHGGTMEPPWGVQGYFRWRQYDNLQVYLDDNYDFPDRPMDKPYVTVDCTNFMPEVK
jgi:hypothetical protein